VVAGISSAWSYRGGYTHFRLDRELNHAEIACRTWRWGGLDPHTDMAEHEHRE
jgi:hypothetical protein